MVSDRVLDDGPAFYNFVLILVLVEDGLWLRRGSIYLSDYRVLILVLVEDGLWQQWTDSNGDIHMVS